MSLYVPRHFATDDVHVAREIALCDPFATLISVDGELPWISHIPMAWGAADSFLAGHLARANGHSRLIERGVATVAVFHGPHAFVSPSFFETPDQVPTWNYAVVHITGRPEVVAEDDASDELLRLSRTFDPGLTLDDKLVRRQVPGIIAFRLPIDRLEIKLKLSQNKSPQDREGVIQALKLRSDADSQAVAAWMERRVQIDSA